MEGMFDGLGQALVGMAIVIAIVSMGVGYGLGKGVEYLYSHYKITTKVEHHG